MKRKRSERERGKKRRGEREREREESESVRGGSRIDRYIYRSLSPSLLSLSISLSLFLSLSLLVTPKTASETTRTMTGSTAVHLDHRKTSKHTNCTIKYKGASRCHGRTFLYKWFHKKPSTSE